MLFKLVFNFGKKIISKCLDQYFQPVVQIHNYPIKFAGNNYFAALLFNKTFTQHIIRYAGSKLWNEEPEKINCSYYRSHNIFEHRIKEYLKGDQN